MNKTAAFLCACVLPLLAACPQKVPVYCNDTKTCCRIQTGPSDYVSQCTDSAAQCSALANGLPKNGQYPITVWPANSVGSIEGCKTGEKDRTWPFGERLPDRVPSPILLAALRPDPQVVLRVATVTNNTGAADACRSSCESHEARCSVLEMSDSSGIPKEQIATGIRELHRQFLDPGLSKIPAAFVLRNFGMRDDPCKREDTTVTMASGTRQLKNSSRDGNSCKILLTVPQGTPGGDIGLEVPSPLQGILGATPPAKTVMITFSEPTFAPSVVFADTAFSVKHGGQILGIYATQDHLYLATEGEGSTRHGCFALEVPPPQVTEGDLQQKTKTK
jgi:hypothetical protein